MKKLFYLITCNLIVFTLLAGCSTSAKESAASSLSPVEKAESPVAAPTDKTPGIQSPTAEPNVKDAPDFQTRARIETIKSGDSRIEHVVVAGFPELNENLETFFTWPLFDVEASDKTVTVTAKYTILGNRYLSVRAYSTEYTKGAAYPVSALNSGIFDLETGEVAGPLSDFVNVSSDLKYAITSKTFVQTYPGVELDGDLTILAAAFVDNAMEYETRFYLTEKGVGLYLSEQPHAAGDYWTFEADYTDVEHLLTQKLLDVLDQ